MKTNICENQGTNILKAINMFYSIFKTDRFFKSLKGISVHLVSRKSKNILGTSFKLRTGKFNIHLYKEPLINYVLNLDVDIEALSFFVLVHEYTHGIYNRINTNMSEENYCDSNGLRYINEYYPENYNEIKDLLLRLRRY